MFRFQTHRNLVPFRRQEIYCFLYWLKYYLDTQVHFIYFFCFRLEQGNWGSKFPRLMNDLYHGRLKSEYVKDALVELKEIKQELAKFQPSDVIWDIEDLSARPPWGDDISPDITNLSNYFVTSDGEDFLLILQHALEKAWECGGDLVIKSM